MSLTAKVDEEYYIVFKEPYDDITRNTNLFTVKAINRMADMLTGGVDVWNTYYHQHGIGYEDYAADVSNNVFFYKLVVDGGASYTVPQSFIINLLKFNTHRYRNTVMTIDLGPLPASEDMTLAKSRLDTCVKNIFGVHPTLYDHSSEQAISVTEQQHTVISTSRASLRTASQPYEAMYNQLALDMERLTMEKEALEAYIINCLECSSCGVEEDITVPPPVFIDTGEDIFITQEKNNDALGCCDWTVSENVLLFTYLSDNSMNFTQFYKVDGMVVDENMGMDSLMYTNN